MKAKQAVREIMEKTGMSQAKLAAKCGMKGQTNVTGILNRCESLRLDKLNQMVSAMGYKIMIVPDSVKGRDGWYDVDDMPPGVSAAEEPKKE